MKIYDLLCAANHRFEGWFNSAADFTRQDRKGLVSCPTCASAQVRRVPAATRVNLGAQAPAQATEVSRPPEGVEGRDPMAIAQILYSRMLDEMLKSSEDVGSSFPEEARRIHYKEVAARSIRGQATAAEHDALVDEGIPVARLPIPSTDQWN